jgi:hypothetical protein
LVGISVSDLGIIQANLSPWTTLRGRPSGAVTWRREFFSESRIQSAGWFVPLVLAEQI